MEIKNKELEEFDSMVINFIDKLELINDKYTKIGKNDKKELDKIEQMINKIREKIE